MATHVGTAELLRLRLASQRIARRGGGAPAVPGETAELPGGASAVSGVLRQLLAVQAQDFAQAVWALGLRTPGATRADVAAALASGEVVRSWPMRRTLHFVAPDDLRWMLELTSARMIAATATQQRRRGLDQDILDRAGEVARTELGGGGAASRAEFTALLEGAGIGTTGQRGYHLIWYLAQIGLLCWGPPRGPGQALVLLDEWAPRRLALSREEALRHCALRYFTGHGPATVRDLAWWSKLTLTDARAGLAAAREQLTELEHGGETFWIATAEWDAAAAPAPAVHALPGFDEYLLGYQDGSHALTAEHASRIVPGTNGIFLPTIVARGRVVGTWRRAIAAGAVAVTPAPFTTLSMADAAGFARAAAAYARFLGLRLNPVGDGWPESR